MISTDLLKGSLKTIILKLLSERGRMYGYEITRMVEEMTAGKIKLTYGALYPVLHKLEREGSLVTESQNYNNRIRIYYSLTPAGESAVIEKMKELKEFLEAMSQIINPSPGVSYE
jgi:DNA-binding PadR family transcriptional regulator